MKSHKGGSLRVRAGRSVDKKQLAALLESAALAPQEPADGPRKGEHHPPKPKGRVERTVPAKSSESLHETLGPSANTPAPTKSSQATSRAIIEAALRFVQEQTAAR